jgi:hypothetical protein
MSIKIVYKQEFAAILSINESCLRNYLNKKYYNELQPLGYERNSKILFGSVLDYLKEKFSVTDSDILEYRAEITGKSD